MKNMNQMMKQVKKMQQQMEKAQEELKNKTVQSSAGGGMVTVVANGHKEIVSIEIKQEVVDPDDIEMLQDLVMTAINDALKQADQLIAQDLGKYTSGLNIPGIF
ncbi:YbaB/EbfC family nucleoid-associated protein [Tepidibacillus infernus]|uniref:YbaB/EbfC family nucleoid-associated protein n=1 Tax=Tepidibacillus infernus TaxID=1806172 RepID=UPI003B6ED4BE